MVVSGRQRQRSGAAPHERGAPDGSTSRGALVAFDYAAKFELTGRPGNVIQDVINISAEGIFVATAIGYGLEENRGRPIQTSGRPQPGQTDGFSLPGDVTLDEIPRLALIEGFRVRQRFESVLFESDQPGGSPSRTGGPGNRRFADQLTPTAITIDAFERVKAPEDISFLFSAVDSGTGRELQDEPTHNLASLGKSNGERPFRVLATPLSFLPRSTVRLQIVERSKDVIGTLFVVLYGYKLLTPSNSPEPVVRALVAQNGGNRADFGGPPERVIPFDYVATVDLIGQSGNVAEDEVTINAEGGFVATALGYGLTVEDPGVRLVPSGEVQGTVTDSTGGAVPGATVTLQNVVTKAEASARIDATNHYRIALMPGEWAISSTLPFVSEGTLKVAPGSSITVNLDSSPGISPTSNGQVATVDLGNLPLRSLPPDALVDGIRIRPELLRIAFENGGQLATTFPIELLDNLFERINSSDDLSFRYSIFDGGRGLELQNRPINNVAGLGIANGDRPFKKFARPMVFLPRSTIRVSVEEHSGRGRLYLAFQGYKVLSAASAEK